MLMRRTVLHAFVTALAVAVGSQTAGAQSTSRGVIDGVVTDTSLVPLGDATISFLGSNVRVITGANGRFRVNDLSPGAWVLIVRRIGFEASSVPVQLSSGDTVRPALVLRRAATKLDTVAIKAQRLTPAMQEFEARRKIGIGHFITQADMERPNVIKVSDALYGVVGVFVTSGGLAINTRSGCAYQIYLDGVMMPGKGILDGIAVPREVAGIEVYTGPAQIPVQYKSTSGGGFCGVILMWTRIGS
jgi:hypothetical protein